MGVAKARIGEKMTGEEADPLTIRLIPAMEGSTRKEPYDSDGNPVTECLLSRTASAGISGEARSTLTI